MIQWKQRLWEIFQKEKALKLVVLLGICGIALIGLSSFWEPAPAQKEELDPVSQEDYSAQLESGISRIVTAITGEEAPTVVVTLADSGRSLYASDQRENTRQEDGASSTERETSHILLEDADGGQSALTVTQTQPEVQGVVVVSAMADDPAVREKLLTAVCTALDVSTARVCVTSRA
ncbi:MAG: hypothetical protein ACOYJZ_07030 [Acutalibacter sp.]